MLKVIIIGSPGAGKSTFGRKLRDATGIPLYYLDMLWHKPNQTHISKQELSRCFSSGDTSKKQSVCEPVCASKQELSRCFPSGDTSKKQGVCEPVCASRQEFDAALGEILKKDSWIIDGNYQRTLEMRLQECDTVFLLDYPLEICLLGAQSRIGQKREDLPWVEKEFDAEFKQQIMDFPKDCLPPIYELLEKYRENKKIIVFKSRKEADNYFNFPFGGIVV